MTIPLSRPDIGPLERKYAADAVASTLISSRGPYVDRFEAAWAERCEARHAVAVCNGTAALVVAQRALGVSRGDEVIVPAFTFAAVAASIVEVGGTPVYVDVDDDTWCIDPRAALAAVTPRTVGIIAVHSFGHPAPMRELLAVRARHGLWLLEDGAEAHLARLNGRTVGAMGDAGAFSFFGNKILAAGEGGAVTTDDAQLARRVRTLGNQGVSPEAADRYRPTTIGTNQRLSNVACALLCAQVERADELLARRRSIDRRYRSLLPEIRWQHQAPGAESVPWLCTGTASSQAERDGIIEALARMEIQARRVFPAIPDLHPYQAIADVPVARALAATGFSLPTYPELPEAAVDLIAERVRLVQHHPVPA